MENNPTWMPVVAGFLRRSSGVQLMQRRPIHKHHGGLWEFPGGKVEHGETPVDALIRELAEELSIIVDPEDCAPMAFAQNIADEINPPIVILLYTVIRWQGEMRAMEASELGWFTIDQMGALAMPPLDRDLVRQLFQ